MDSTGIKSQRYKEERTRSSNIYRGVGVGSTVLWESAVHRTELFETVPDRDRQAWPASDFDRFDATASQPDPVGPYSFSTRKHVVMRSFPRRLVE